MTTTFATVSTTDGAKIFRTQSRAFAAAQRVAAELGTGANPLGSSGAGNVAVGCITRGEYVICIRTRENGSERFEWVAE